MELCLSHSKLRNLVSHGRYQCAIGVCSMLDILCCPVLFAFFTYLLLDLKQSISSGCVRSCHVLLVTWNGRGTMVDLQTYTASSRITGFYDHNRLCFLVRLLLILDNELLWSGADFCSVVLQQTQVFWSVTVFQCITAVVAVLASVAVIAYIENQEKVSLMFVKKLTMQVCKMGSNGARISLIQQLFY